MENTHIRHLTAEDGRELWILLTKRTAYAFGLDEHGYLQHRYWGKRLSLETDYGWPAAFGHWAFERAEGISQEEYPAWGDVNYNEPCIKATFDDGVRNVVLRYESFSISARQRTSNPHYLHDRCPLPPGCSPQIPDHPRVRPD